MELPTLGGFVRARRERRGMSRQELATAIHSSLGYIAKIEQGGAAGPSPAVLEALSEVYGLDADERRHLYRLAGQTPEDPPATAPAHRGTLDAFAPHPAAYRSETGDVLDANAAHDATFPGLRRHGNVLRWLFTDPRARLVHEEWEREARIAVGMLRHHAACPRDPGAVARLLGDLAEQPDFHRLWSADIVSVARPDPHLRLRRPGTGEVFTLRTELFADTADPARQLWLGVPSS
ncbi:helix-turn-helix transcriptional regulator [Nocardia farcinica]|uniref:helix-turn-helix transcriptional regulator n=1 Tax=Nocardia farcinica TaxID=37329 RepID=UPI001C0EDB00|nr:helix-turn-helix transcriptional regulator [Nocardia farcinica]